MRHGVSGVNALDGEPLKDGCHVHLELSRSEDRNVKDAGLDEESDCILGRENI